MSATPDRGQGGLLERGAELAAIAACAEAVAAGEGRAVVVQGPPGIGKTELVAAARAMACEAGLRPLAARGTEIERAFGFGVVRQLLEPAVRDDPDATDFDGPARYAADLLGRSLAEPAAVPLGPEGAFVVQHGLYHVAANLARRRALALLVDDAHWADTASLRFLAYVANRLARAPILLVLAARPPGEPGSAAVATLLEGAEGAIVLRPAPLGDVSSAAIVRAAVPHAEAALCQACHMHDRRKPVLPGRAGACAARGRPRSGGRRARPRARGRGRLRAGPPRPLSAAPPGSSPAPRRSWATAR